MPPDPTPPVKARTAAAQVPVDGLAVGVYRVPTDYPEADGTIAWDTTTLLVVHARAADARGLGWTYGSAAGAQLVAGVLVGEVLGRCALDVPAAYHAMCHAVRNVGRPGIAATAISAVDIALWDLKARLLDVRLARLLGTVHDVAPVYGSGGFTTYDDQRLTEQLTGWVRCAWEWLSRPH